MLASLVRHLIAIDPLSPAILNSIVCNGPATQPTPLRYGVLRKVAPHTTFCGAVQVFQSLEAGPANRQRKPEQAQKRYNFMRLLAHEIARNNSF